jgi:uncharacterized protein YkwD
MVAAVCLLAAATPGAVQKPARRPAQGDNPSASPSKPDVAGDLARAGEPNGENEVLTDDDIRIRAPRSSNLNEIETLEERCFNEVNRLRVSKGLAPLTFNDDLLQVARDYSHRMSEEKFFAHGDPDGHTVRERVSDAHIRWHILGENLAFSNGYINPVAVSLSGWMNSPGHRRNLLDRAWKQTAIGAWVSDDGTVYFTEIFLTP